MSEAPSGISEADINASKENEMSHVEDSASSVNEKPQLFKEADTPEVFFQKLGKGEVSFDDCSDNTPILEEKGQLRVTGKSKGPRARGAEGRVLRQAYELLDIKRGRVLSPPADTFGVIKVDFLAAGEEYQASMKYALGRVVFPRLYENLDRK